MRKGTTKLKKYEQFQPEEEVAVAIDTKRLNDLIEMAYPLLDEIGRIIEQEDDRTISNEMRNRIIAAVEALDELKMMY